MSRATPERLQEAQHAGRSRTTGAALEELSVHPVADADAGTATAQPEVPAGMV